MYLLPTHESFHCLDPLGLCPDDLPKITQSDVLNIHLEQAAGRLPAEGASVLAPLIEDIAYSLYANGKIDVQHLKLALRSSEDHRGSVNHVLEAARSLSKVFPSNSLPYIHISKKSSHTTFDGGQIDAILAHEILGTLAPPDGNTWGIPGFTSWYTANPVHPNAVDGYLKTILDHFRHGGYDKSASFNYKLFTANEMQDPATCFYSSNLTLIRVQEEFEPSELSSPSFVLVAAHSQPGPGPSGTQEERLQAASPALSVASLVCPVLPEASAVVTSAIPVHASWRGHNRNARLQNIFPPHARPSRHYILADALQLDLVDSDNDFIKDLSPGNVDREVRKLFAAFTGAKSMGGNENSIVEATPWGCQAFGGNFVVKALCMMIASGLTGVTVQLHVLENRIEEIELLSRILDSQPTVAKLWNMLHSKELSSCRSSREIVASFFQELT